MSPFERLLEVALADACEPLPNAPFEASIQAFEKALADLPASAAGTRAASLAFAPGVAVSHPSHPGRPVRVESSHHAPGAKGRFALYAARSAGAKAPQSTYA